VVEIAPGAGVSFHLVVAASIGDVLARADEGERCSDNKSGVVCMRPGW